MLKYVAWSSTLPLVLLMHVVGRTSTFLYSQVRKVIMRSTDCYFGVYDDLDLVTQSEGNTLSPPAASRQATMCLLFIYWQHRLWPPWTYCSKESTCWVSFRQPRNMFQNLFGASHWSLAFSWITLITFSDSYKYTLKWPQSDLLGCWFQWPHDLSGGHEGGASAVVCFHPPGYLPDCCRHKRSPLDTIPDMCLWI